MLEWKYIGDAKLLKFIKERQFDAEIIVLSFDSRKAKIQTEIPREKN